MVLCIVIFLITEVCKGEGGEGVILYTGLSYIQVNTVLCFCVILSFKEKQ